MENKFYKPSNNFSFVGFILLILSVTVVGSLISVVYLKINEISPSAYLCVLVAVGVGALLGVISKFFVNKFKMRNPVVTVVAVAIGCLFFTYFKWGLYCYWDTKSVFYEEWDSLYPTFYDYAVEDTDEEYTAQDFLNDFCNGMNIEEAKDKSFSEVFFSSDYDVNEFYVDLLLYYGYEEDAELVSIKEKPFIEYRGLVGFLARPDLLIENIKFINEDGRWTIGSSPSSLGSNNSVHGVMLWIVWLGELVILCAIPLVMARSRSAHPFIEYEDNWADEYKNKLLGVVDFPINSAVKNNIINNPKSLFDAVALTGIPTGSNYIHFVILHSKDYSESYLTVERMVYNAKNKSYTGSAVIKYLKVDFEFVEMLFDFCKIDKPFPETQKYNFSLLDSETAPTSDQPNFEEIFDK